MRNTWAVCKREFKSYFLTPIGYVVVGMVSLISGLAFSISFLTHVKMTQSPQAYAYTAVPDFEESLLSPFMVFCGTLIMFISPLITMRLLAEEKHQGTMELLLTFPLRDREIIFGKYLAALGMVLIMMLIIGVDLIIVAQFVDVEPTVLLFGLLAVFLMGAAFISMGMFISAIAKNQITAGTLAFGLMLLIFIAGNLGEELPTENPAPGAWPDFLRVPVGFFCTIFRALIIELQADVHAEQMALGIVQPQDVIYYVLFSAFFLFLTFRAFESRQWRG